MAKGDSRRATPRTVQQPKKVSKSPQKASPSLAAPSKKRGATRVVLASPSKKRERTGAGVNPANLFRTLTRIAIIAAVVALLGAISLNIMRMLPVFTITAIDTEALCNALQEGRLGGAGLDVTDPEPLPKEHRLWDMPNAVVTPHISGFYHLRQTYERIVGICLENLTNYRDGKPLRNIVDEATGYRALREE